MIRIWQCIQYISHWRTNLRCFWFFTMKTLLCQTFLYIYLCAYVPAFCQKKFLKKGFLLQDCFKNWKILSHYPEKRTYQFVPTLWNSLFPYTIINIVTFSFGNLPKFCYIIVFGSYFPEDLRGPLILALATWISSSTAFHSPPSISHELAP